MLVYQQQHFASYVRSFDVVTVVRVFKLFSRGYKIHGNVGNVQMHVEIHQKAATNLPDNFVSFIQN